MLKGIGFCVTINHASSWLKCSLNGITSEHLSQVDDVRCQEMLTKLKDGRLTFLFTVDKLSGVFDVRR